MTPSQAAWLQRMKDMQRLRKLAQELRENKTKK
jgi:hypothetical protein